MSKIEITRQAGFDAAAAAVEALNRNRRETLEGPGHCPRILHEIPWQGRVGNETP